MKNILVVIAALCIAATVYGGTITATSNDATDIYQLRKELVYAVNNRCLSPANLKMNASAKTKIQTASATTTIHNGVFQAVPATTTISFSDTTPIPAGKRAYVVVGVDAAGVFSTKHSPAAAYDHQLIVPMLDEGIAPLGLVKIVVSTPGSFTPNVTPLDNASCTVTFTNLSTLPLSLNMKQR